MHDLRLCQVHACVRHRAVHDCDSRCAGLHNLLELPETTLEVGHHSQHEGEKEGAWEDGGEAVAEEGGLEEGEHDKPVEEQP